MMKKTVSLVALLLLCLCSSAQSRWQLGGAFSLGNGPDKNLSIYIAPEVGYYVSNHFSLGGRLSYQSGYNRFGVDPYMRFDLLKPDSPLRILASVHAPLRFSSNTLTYGVYFQPGLSLRAGDNVRIECLVGAFGWGGATTGSTRYSGWEATVNSNNIRLGVVFSI